MNYENRLSITDPREKRSETINNKKICRSSNICSKKPYFRHKIREELFQYQHLLHQSSIIPIIGLTLDEVFVEYNVLKNKPARFGERLDD